MEALVKEHELLRQHFFLIELTQQVSLIKKGYDAIVLNKLVYELNNY